MTCVTRACLVLLGSAVCAPSVDAQSLLHLLLGDSAYDRFGNVSSSGDVDGDGCADLVVGARYDDATGHSSGSAYVFSGQSGALLHTFSGTASYQLFALAVGHAGDIDQDGFDDVLVGAYADDSNGFKSGAAKVFSGADGALLQAWFGEKTSTELGWSVSGGADLNGDGIADIVAGAPDETGGPGGGSARVYSGAGGQLIYKMWGNAAVDVFGHTVTTLLDADGDGFADFAVSAIAADTAAGIDAGQVKVFSGRDGSPLHVFGGEGAYDNFGVWVQSAGDVDGDGRGDVIVGAYRDDDGGVDAGSAMVFSGTTGQLLRRHDGAAALEHFGHAVSGAGDVDGDGHDDYLVGAPHASANGFEAGRAALYSGRDGSLLREYVGDTAGDRLGGSVSDVFDVNGDGFSDIALGALGDDKNGAESGSVFVYSGCDGCGIHSYGEGCAGSLQAAPALYLAGDTKAGGQLSVEIAGGPPLAPATLLIGSAGAGVPIGGGCTLLLSALSWIVGPLPLDAGGAVVLSTQIPAGLTSLSLAVQAAMPAVGSPVGFVLTNGVAISIGP